MGVIDEISIVFYAFSVFQDLAAHLCVAAHRLRNTGLMGVLKTGKVAKRKLLLH